MTLTPRELAFWPNEESAEFGLLYCEDERGERITVRGDPQLVRMLRDASPEMRADLDLGGEWERIDGWPEDWHEPTSRGHIRGNMRANATLLADPTRITMRFWLYHWGCYGPAWTRTRDQPIMSRLL